MAGPGSYLSTDTQPTDGTDPNDPAVQARVRAKLANPAAPPPAAPVGVNQSTGSGDDPYAPGPTLDPPPADTPPPVSPAVTPPVSSTGPGSNRQYYPDSPPVSTAGPVATAPGPSQQPGVPDAGTGPAGSSAPLGSFAPGMSDDAVRALANQYIDKGGAKNIDNGQYWVDAYHRMDPGYLQSRLQQGVSDQAGYNGAFGAAHQTPGPSGDVGSWTSGAGMPPPADAGASSAFNAQLRQMLLDRMKGDSATVNESDPYISAPLQAARDEAARNQDTERSDLAEHLAATGQSGSAALGQGIQQSAERNAMGLSGLRAKLITGELQSRRADLQDAYHTAVASGDSEAARQLQGQMALLDAQLRREAIGANLGIDQANQNANANKFLTG